MQLSVSVSSLGYLRQNVLHDCFFWALKRHHQPLQDESQKAWHQHSEIEVGVDSHCLMFSPHLLDVFRWDRQIIFLWKQISKTAGMSSLCVKKIKNKKKKQIHQESYKWEVRVPMIFEFLDPSILKPLPLLFSHGLGSTHFFLCLCQLATKRVLSNAFFGEGLRDQVLLCALINLIQGLAGVTLPFGFK